MICGTPFKTEADSSSCLLHLHNPYLYVEDSFLVHSSTDWAGVPHSVHGQLFQCVQAGVVEDVGTGAQHRLLHLAGGRRGRCLRGLATPACLGRGVVGAVTPHAMARQWHQTDGAVQLTSFHCLSMKAS